ncbi:nitrogenase-stabilizing/protective protein NifW [Paludibacterium yongneupense]|uniref:nitrogenase-stabilizing/protective protein NifW n=1 Tax=Paludibacterium yongneupense TaxID=400061 RepID=UPI00040D6478|nr:nitrogenase-stabilizing/protective protein NifW [Paludibacterium yongneupense]
MDKLMQRMARLSSIEDFLGFFDLPYDMAVVNVSRLHILKRFYLYLRAEDTARQSEEEGYQCCRRLLARAYDDFLHTTPAEARLFKVFHGGAVQQIPLERVRASLPQRNNGAHE